MGLASSVFDVSDDFAADEVMRDLASSAFDVSGGFAADTVKKRSLLLKLLEHDEFPSTL
jgi:hypothetical protein